MTKLKLCRRTGTKIAPQDIGQIIQCARIKPVFKIPYYNSYQKRQSGCCNKYQAKSNSKEHAGNVFITTWIDQKQIKQNENCSIINHHIVILN